MPRRHRLVLVSYALEHGTTVAGPHPDPDQVEAEAWAHLRRKLAYLDRARLRPERTYNPHGGLVLRVLSLDSLTPVGVVTLHARLAQVRADGPDAGRETGRTDDRGGGGEG